MTPDARAAAVDWTDKHYDVCGPGGHGTTCLEKSFLAGSEWRAPLERVAALEWAVRAVCGGCNFQSDQPLHLLHLCDAESILVELDRLKASRT